MLSVGDQMPFCAGMDADHKVYSFDVQAGRAAVLVLGGLRGPEALDPLIAALAAHRGALEAMASDLRVILDFSVGAEVWETGPGAACGVAAIVCGGEFFIQCGMPDWAALVAVIDRAGRVRACWSADQAEPEVLAAAALVVAGRLGREEVRDCVLPAPVLAVPGIFSDDFCRDLIRRFESGLTFDSGMSGAKIDGSPNDRVDYRKKRRRDWLIAPGDEVYDEVHGRLFRRCAPEMKRAFQYEISHADRILVARYDDSGGYFKRHRDNLAPAVAFRRFAISVNLNAGEYEGGHLLFPEFNDHRYAPATGEGLVFSGSLLHEATPVTRGRRYVLLTFLHDQTAESLRLKLESTAP